MASVRKLLKYNQKVCLVVKANAYGFGAKQICENLNNLVDMFAVSCGYEFLKLKSVTNKPILILDPIYENITKLAKKGACFTVSNFESLQKIVDSAQDNFNLKYNIHIAFNTGMNRFGFNKNADVLKVFEIAQKTQNIAICGVFSHYFDANNKIYAKNQFEKFDGLKKFLDSKLDLSKIDFHICNSDGTANFNGFDMVRLGLGAYKDDVFSTIKLASKILDIKHLNVGDGAGYGHVFIATKKTKIAIVGIGYADGIPWNIFKKGYVLIGGEFCKIVAICMDSILVDVTIVDCKIEDEVVVIGKQKNRQIFICDVARWCDTISYDVISKISARVKRKYIR